MLLDPSAIRTYMLPSEIAARAGVSRDTIRRALLTGELPSLLTRAGRIVAPEDAAAYVRARQERVAERSA